MVSVRIEHTKIVVVGQATDEDRLLVEAEGPMEEVAQSLGDMADYYFLGRIFPDRTPEETGLDGPPDPYTGSHLPNDPPSGPRLVIEADKITLYGQGPGPEDGGLSMARNPETVARLATILKAAGKPLINVILPWDGPKILASLEPSGHPGVEWDLVCTWAEDPRSWALGIFQDHLEPDQKVQVGPSTPRLAGSVGGSHLLVLGGPGDVARVFRYVPTALVEWLPEDLPAATEGEGDGGPPSPEDMTIRNYPKH